MNDTKDIVTTPIFFERNRVYRIYHGGKPFKALFDDGYDDNAETLLPLLRMHLPPQTPPPPQKTLLPSPLPSALPMAGLLPATRP